MEQPKSCEGPVGEKGPAWWDDFAVEELLERIISDAYAIGEKIGRPPMRELLPKWNRFPKNIIFKLWVSRCGSKSTSSLTIGTRAVRFKTQRPQYKAFCYGRALFLFAE